jgi:flagellar protein FliO/FliZ
MLKRRLTVAFFAGQIFPALNRRLSLTAVRLRPHSPHPADHKTREGPMEYIDALRYFGALLLVLALVGAAGLVARRYGIPGVARGVGNKRLAVVESLIVGRNQRLFILRRDDVEHLVLTTPDGATVVESNIPPKNPRPGTFKTGASS